jgi:uncharacterized damage-inducible protein DinB
MGRVIEMGIRVDPPWSGPERESLIGWLQYHRDTLEMKCDGLSPDQLAQRSVPPSTMSLIGLVRHMTEVERNWFRRVIGGEGDDTAGPLYYERDTNDDGDFDDVSAATADADLAAWSVEMGIADAVLAGVDLDETRFHVRFDVDLSVRWIVTHMIEEYARHNGHADLLRQRIDGAIGD